jgi:hypothetical protein
MGISAIDYDIALLEIRQERAHDIVNRLPSRHEHHECPRLLEVAEAFFKQPSAGDALSPALLFQGYDLVWFFIETDNGKAVVGHVQGKVPAHDAEADHADCILLLCLLIGHGFACRAVC